MGKSLARVWDEAPGIFHRKACGILMLVRFKTLLDTLENILGAALNEWCYARPDPQLEGITC